jgi:hypothetical protein
MQDSRVKMSATTISNDGRKIKTEGEQGRQEAAKW